MFPIVITCVFAQLPSQPPKIGVVADELVDYSQWAAPHKELWSGVELVRLLTENGAATTLLKRNELSLEGFSRFDAMFIATDNSYPEFGPWGGSVAGALKEYVQRGGIYLMPLGVPHYASYDLDSGKLDRDHWEDFFHVRAATVAGRGPLLLTKQGKELGLRNPDEVHATAARSLNFEKSVVLVWDASYTPALSVAPYGNGWLVHWGAGPENGMDATVRDFLLATYVKLVPALKSGALRVQTYQELLADEGLVGKSLDDRDREVFQPGPAPFESEPMVISLRPASSEASVAPERLGLSLDGDWQMLGLPNGRGDARSLAMGEGWHEAVSARVPCSVQTALFAAGKIPDPVVGFNDQIARKEVAEKEWWFRKDFEWQPGKRAGLVFDGVDYSATFFLNGVRLGEHEGPFGGPVYDVTGLLRSHNTLVVRVDPLPPDWKLVFKTNCVYGWHYVNCPPIGIWQSVRVEPIPNVEIAETFVAATDVSKGTVDLHVVLNGPEGGFSGTLSGRIAPANFEGKAHTFDLTVQSGGAAKTLHLRFDVPEPRLWWPVDLGEPNLYSLDASFTQADVLLDQTTTRFGIRTIEMKPLPGGPRPDYYNWTFVINSRPSFMKGCNWATIDAFLRLDASRYRRFLTMARDEHIQIMRSWGGGLLETDTFYDLCNELGIMVWQEFPLTWQNFEVIRPSVADEIATLNIKRIRNHPSLALWCGGNEHSGQGALIELLGRRCLELDGTRPYHRTDPYGGSVHDYGVYWGKGPYEHNLKLVPLEGGPPVIGETGLASACALESTLRFLPEEERGIWPPPEHGAFIHHTPTFRTVDMEHLNRHAKELDPCDDLAGFTRATQLAQSIGLRAVIERMRVKWPESTAMVFYKLTDVFPGCSWSTVDYFGVPKIAHYFVQDALAPLHVCALYDSFDVTPGKTFPVQIRVADDLEMLEGLAQLHAQWLDGGLRSLYETLLERKCEKNRVHDFGTVSFDVPVQVSSPLFLKVDLRNGEEILDRTFHWFNFRRAPGCLWRLPQTTLEIMRDANSLTIRNGGAFPAVAVHFNTPDASDSLRYEDSYFWLEPGEVRRVAVTVEPNIEGQPRTPNAIEVLAWNSVAEVATWNE
ncbi:MAG: hypothetical protein HY706_17015 [Candidatus Hydrogenedentes bacterium]|nr:hypothetical protein [Candidatus Hydrogenedentota bacterium]